MTVFLIWLHDFLHTLATTSRDIAPIAVLFIFFQLVIIRKPLANPGKILWGFILVLLGIAFFLKGLQLALFPLGEMMAQQLTSHSFLNVSPHQMDWSHYGWIYAFAACIGFATTLAEPSLLAIALKAEDISGGAIKSTALRLTVSIGVAAGITLGVWRIITGLDLYYFILVGYLIVMVQTFFAPKLIIGLAYDSGGVTTSTVTVPLVTALGLGLANTVPDRNPLLDGFGLIAFASLFPIIAVLAYAQIASWLARHRRT
ncbi:DUF1538 domain-containing protein [methane-oxidizing endosymbiont of Gigantopelta aegis]|uniref:DUF1538 domain-containing protein n=1 Tax=methane-oxidizing endosymbiont of Gigantopelta aegis TaxID=2794938 RepID=UPI0018DE03CE|nr:DUF1538 domain-containing protein [methane-oxidizing endosymbiont of Gigantopelta aegis]